MIILQSDLFRGTGKHFVKKVMDLTEKVTFEKGEVLFREGDQTRHFYILLRGCVRIATGETGQIVHTVSRAGEVFGWSSLVGRDLYSATAQCVAPSKLLKIDRDEIQQIMDEDPSNGLIVYRSLAGAIGRRLVNSYRALLLAQPTEAQRTHGSSLTLQQASGES
jgi:CRP-like cAMP-binding protein